MEGSDQSSVWQQMIEPEDKPKENPEEDPKILKAYLQLGSIQSFLSDLTIAEWKYWMPVGDYLCVTLATATFQLTIQSKKTSSDSNAIPLETQNVDARSTSSMERP